MSLKIAVIIASNRPGRIGPKVADWFMAQIKDVDSLSFDLIDLAEVNLPFLDEPNPPMMGEYTKDHTKKWSALIAGYDGYVFVTPEYNHAYPASLKNAIDYLHAEWAHKPVGFVGYGVTGASAAIEHLVNPLVQLNMVPLLSSSVKIAQPWTAFDDKGNIDPEKITVNADGLVKNLKWCAETLKTARSQVGSN